MSTLLIGFDSAWTEDNRGALVGALRSAGGTREDLGDPELVNFVEAADRVSRWIETYQPSKTIVLLDQPTIVRNNEGQRPVENLVSSPISLRYGGVQPANLKRADMFGSEAPVWSFLHRFGGPADPIAKLKTVSVIETYPVLSLIGLGWICSDEQRLTGRLPKYNPERRKTFQLADWQFVCSQTKGELEGYGLSGLAAYMEKCLAMQKPKKPDQDRVDACICLIVALRLVESQDCVMIGNMDSGYMVVPATAAFVTELDVRCRETGREPGSWITALKPFV